MTRAEETLTLCEFEPGNPFTAALGPQVQSRSFDGSHKPELDVQYQTLTLGEVDLGFAGRQRPTEPVHEAIAKLEPGDALEIRLEGERYVLLDCDGNTVGRTAKSFRLSLELESCEVAGIVTRFKEDTEQSFIAMVRCEQWEVVVPRLRGRP